VVYETVLGVGCVVTRSEHVGYFELRLWTRTTASPEAEQTIYDDLTIAEVVDVIDAHIVGRQPGHQRIDGCWQPALF